MKFAGNNEDSARMAETSGCLRRQWKRCRASIRMNTGEPCHSDALAGAPHFGLEAKDLFAVLAVAVVMNICGRFLNREMFGPALEYGLAIPGADPQWRWFSSAASSKSHVYSALEADRDLTGEYEMPLTTMEQYQKSLAYSPLC